MSSRVQRAWAHPRSFANPSRTKFAQFARVNNNPELGAGGRAHAFVESPACSVHFFGALEMRMFALSVWQLSSLHLFAYGCVLVHWRQSSVASMCCSVIGPGSFFAGSNYNFPIEGYTTCASRNTRYGTNFVLQSKHLLPSHNQAASTNLESNKRSSRITQ